MKMISVFCLAALLAAGFSGCGAKACCKDKSGCEKCATEKSKGCGSGCTKPCCAGKDKPAPAPDGAMPSG